MSEFNETDLSDAAYDFKKIVWPAISPKIGGGDLIQIENTKDPLATKLDRFAGIDAIQQINGQLRTIACRVQWGDTDWSAFSVRESKTNGAETEFAKRLNAINNDFVYPILTIQAYISEKRIGKLLSVGCIKTIKLYKNLEAKKISGNLRTRSSGNAIFIFANWSYLPDAIVFRPE